VKMQEMLLPMHFLCGMIFQLIFLAAKHRMIHTGEEVPNILHGM